MLITAMLFMAHAELDIRERLQGYTSAAHQGGIYALNANTLKRFESARKDGIDIIELDLRASKDGKAVVYHDKTLNVWTKCKGEVQSKTLAEIKNCKFRFNKEKIPSFEEVLAWAQGRVVINAEFKDLESIEDAVAAVQKFEAWEWVFFQTKGDPERYYRARGLDERVALLFAPTTMEQLEWSLALHDERLIVIELSHPRMIKEDNIRLIHAHNKFALADTWKTGINEVLGYIQELFHARCKISFEMGFDIGVSNNPKSCTKQAQWANNNLP